MEHVIRSLAMALMALCALALVNGEHSADGERSTSPQVAKVVAAVNELCDQQPELCQDDDDDVEEGQHGASKRAPFVRLGKRAPFVRLGKRAPFVRLGRALAGNEKRAPFVRLGKKSADEDKEEAKRAPFVRLGRAPFVRLG